MDDVVVIGAGVSGIQAALDLANHGIIVHLVEREPTIGGHMAQARQDVSHKRLLHVHPFP